MAIWYVQKLYTSEGCFYEALSYDFVGTIKVTLKMKNGIWQMIKFLLDSRLTENEARKLANKKNNRKTLE